MGFNLIQDGSQFTSPQRQLELLDLLLKGDKSQEVEDEKFTNYVLFYWKNMEGQKLSELFQKTFGKELIHIGRTRVNLVFHFQEGVSTFKYREDFKYTWKEWINLINGNFQGVK